VVFAFFTFRSPILPKRHGSRVFLFGCASKAKQTRRLTLLLLRKLHGMTIAC
jgi:hypothetical protein